MSTADAAAVALALALDAFMAEHRRCWRLYGEGLETGQDGEVLWLKCGGCEAVMTFSAQ